MSLPPSNEPVVPSGIVVTVPSSPEIPAVTPQRDGQKHIFPVMSTSPYGHSFETDALRVPTPRPPLPLQESPSSLTTTEVKSHFENLMETANLPEPGPAYFEARRALWHTPSPHIERGPRITPPNRRKLEDILQKFDGKLDEDEVWFNGLDKVWKGLITGARLRTSLSLRYLIQILQAGWVRDGTWPKGGIAPDPDDELNTMQNHSNVPSASTSAYASRVGSPIPSIPIQNIASNRRGFFSR
ncbi:hypothetical protein QCA50_000372 [Cerrena zonata]|uniref:Uncharacterized protein n=1 Tax=Cerrena zonata TaxID=2478898 RepID=A0AAW0GQG8_9APHY